MFGVSLSTLQSHSCFTGVVSNITDHMLNHPVSGLLGLAFPTISVSHSVPFWLNIAAQPGYLDDALVAFQLTRYVDDDAARNAEPGGTFSIGSVNASLYTGDIDYQDVPDGHVGYWILPLTCAYPEPRVAFMCLTILQFSYLREYLFRCRDRPHHHMLLSILVQLLSVDHPPSSSRSSRQSRGASPERETMKATTPIVSNSYLFITFCQRCQPLPSVSLRHPCHGLNDVRQQQPKVVHFPRRLQACAAQRRYVLGRAFRVQYITRYNRSHVDYWRYLLGAYSVSSSVEIMSTYLVTRKMCTACSALSLNLL